MRVLRTLPVGSLAEARPSPPILRLAPGGSIASSVATFLDAMKRTDGSAARVSAPTLDEGAAEVRVERESGERESGEHERLLDAVMLLLAPLPVASDVPAPKKDADAREPAPGARAEGTARASVRPPPSRRPAARTSERPTVRAERRSVRPGAPLSPRPAEAPAAASLAPLIAQTSTASEGAPRAEGAPIAERKPIAAGKPSAERKPNAAGKPIAEGKPIAAGKPIAEGKPSPDGEPSPDRAASAERTPPAGLPAPAPEGPVRERHSDIPTARPPRAVATPSSPRPEPIGARRPVDHSGDRMPDRVARPEAGPTPPTSGEAPHAGTESAEARGPAQSAPEPSAETSAVIAKRSRIASSEAETADTERGEPVRAQPELTAQAHSSVEPRDASIPDTAPLDTTAPQPDPRAAADGPRIEARSLPAPAVPVVSSGGPEAPDLAPSEPSPGYGGAFLGGLAQSGTDARARLEVWHPSLGALTVELAERGGTVGVEVSAPTAAAAVTVRASETALRAELKEAGAELRAFRVRTRKGHVADDPETDAWQPRSDDRRRI